MKCCNFISAVFLAVVKKETTEPDESLEDMKKEETGDVKEEPTDEIKTEPTVDDKSRWVK